MDCREAESLLFLGDPRVAGGEALDAHLGSCGSCRQAAGDAGALAARLRALPLPGVPPLRRPVRIPVARWAAAASLLAAAAALWAFRPAPGPAPSAAAPVCRPVLREAAEGFSAAPGAGLLSPSPGAPAMLERGALWFRAGRPLRLGIPGGILRLEAGEGAVLSDPSPSLVALLLGSAEAAEGGETLLVLLEGARASLEAGPAWAGPRQVRLRPGLEPESLSLDAEGLSVAFAVRDAAEGAGPWRDLPPDGLVFPLSPGIEDLALEAEIRVPRGVQLGFLYPAGGGTSRVTLGSGALAPGAWQRFRLRCRSGRLEVYAGARRVASSPFRKGEGDLPRAGLESWGGAVDVRSLRWRALGAGP